MAVSEITVDEDFEYFGDVGDSSIRQSRFFSTRSFASFSLACFIFAEVVPEYNPVWILPTPTHGIYLPSSAADHEVWGDKATQRY